MPEVLTNLAYPVGDLALLAVIVGAVALARWRLDRTWLLLAAGVLAFWFADSLYLVTNANGTYDSGSWFDAGWNAAYLLWAGAAWMPQRRAAQAVEGGDLRVVVMPLLFALVSLGLLSGAAMSSMNPLAAVLATLSLLAVFGRLVLAYRLNTDLLSATRQDALTDTLTGLGNRRHLDPRPRRRLPREPPRTGRIVLALFDLDGFKYYNDTFGHPAGDALLDPARRRRCRRSSSGRGRAYRMGGDEFCALLEGTRRRPAAPRPGSPPARCTPPASGSASACSYGVVELPTEATTPEEALRDRRPAHVRPQARRPRLDRAPEHRRAAPRARRALPRTSRATPTRSAAFAAAVAERLGLHGRRASRTCAARPSCTTSARSPSPTTSSTTRAR